MDKLPAISIIIPSVSGVAYLQECLAALQKQVVSVHFEVIVVDRLGLEPADFLSRPGRALKFLAVGPSLGVGRMRTLGIQAAQGEIVALTEDHCVPPVDWLASIYAAHKADAGPVIGGRLENTAVESLIDRAVFVLEYLPFTRPFPNGPVRSLAAANVSYKKNILRKVLPPEKEFFEAEVHDRIRGLGHQLIALPAPPVAHQFHLPAADHIRIRYHYSRWYAGNRAVGMHMPQKLVYALLAPALPPLIMCRLAFTAAPRRWAYAEILRTFPWIIFLILVWAGGEVVGHLFGPGDSERHIV